jgi:AraC family transcriptional regulator
MHRGIVAGLGFTRDPVIEQLGHALLAADAMSGNYGALYADGVSQAIITRFLDIACNREAVAASRPNVSALPKWRLRRATDYVAAHLAEAITLADLAASAGLTQMHFAAQFRATTGLRPHEYLMRQRIERAQHLLTHSTVSVIEIARTVGFKNQSHFTGVFRRFTGQTPYRWRQESASGRMCSNLNVRRGHKAGLK